MLDQLNSAQPKIGYHSKAKSPCEETKVTNNGKHDATSLS